MEIYSEILSKYRDDLKESKSVFNPVFSVWYNDFQYYLSDQWNAADKAVLDKAKVPALSLNMLKKIVDTVVGYERQNKTDIKVNPIEGADEANAEIYTRLIKWTVSRRNQEFVFSDAFKDSMICSLGWVHTYIDYNDDLINGDIKLKKISPSNIFIDPRTSEKDLGDCQYLIRFQTVHKKKIKNLYPKYAEAIEKLKGYASENEATMDTAVPSDNGNYVIMSEYWRREYEQVFFKIDPADPTNPIQVQTAEEGSISKTVCKIKMSVIIGGELVVFDGLNPYKTDDFPFVPLWAYFDSSFDDWEWKSQGLVRPLKDVQNEKNKFRSQIAHAVNTQVHSGWIVEEGAVDDHNALRNSSGAGKVVTVRRGRMQGLQKAQPPDVPIALMNVHTLLSEDFVNMSLNPDLLGMISEKGSAGVTVQIRQKQGLAALQEIFDNVSLAKRNLGRLLLQMIINSYTRDKIKRILGSDISVLFQPAEKRKIEKIIQELKFNLKEFELHGEAVIAEAQMVSGAIPQSAEDVDAINQKAESISSRSQMLDENIQQVKDQIMQYEAYIKQREMDEQAFWDSFEMYKNTTFYDTQVDESVNSPTYRLSNQMMFTQLAQSGVQYSPRIYLELADIPKTTKDKLLAEQEKAEQQQAAMVQAQQEQQMALQQEKIKTERMKAIAGASGKGGIDEDTITE